MAISGPGLGFFHLSVFTTAHPSIYLGIHPSTHLCIHQFIPSAQQSRAPSPSPAPPTPITGVLTTCLPEHRAVQKAGAVSDRATVPDKLTVLDALTLTDAGGYAVCSQHNSGQPNPCDASRMFSEEVWVGRRVGFVFSVGSKKEGRWGSGVRASETVGAGFLADTGL